MFDKLIDILKVNPRKIVFTEGPDARILDAAAKRYGKTFGLDLIGRTLDTFLYRLVSQAFKRNCAPDGIRVFSFDFSKESWSIPSDMPTGIL